MTIFGRAASILRKSQKSFSRFSIKIAKNDFYTNINQPQVTKIKSLRRHTLTETSLYVVLFDKGNVHNKFKILYSIT